MRSLLIFAVIFMLSAPVQATAREQSNGYVDNAKQSQTHTIYLAKNKYQDSELPPGLQKKQARGKELPPGWKKKLRKGEYLDRETYRHTQRLHHDLEVLLPPLPPGVSYRQIEDVVLKIRDANRKIIEVLEKNNLPVPPAPPLPPIPRIK